MKFLKKLLKGSGARVSEEGFKSIFEIITGKFLEEILKKLPEELL